MDFLVVSQGMLGDQSGRPLADVLAEGLEQAADRLRQHQGGRYFQLPFRLVHQMAGATPLGYERYEILSGDVLGPRQTNWDSKD